MRVILLTQPGSDIDEVADTVKDELLEGPKGKAFNRELSMSYFLSNSVRMLLGVMLVQTSITL